MCVGYLTRLVVGDSVKLASSNMMLLLILLQAFWSGCNADGDGKVTKAEFFKYMGVRIKYSY